MKMEITKPCNKKESWVVLNVGGVQHKTTWSTLERIQGTRLSKLAEMRENDESYNPEDNEYFFDRNPAAFHCILEYYRLDFINYIIAASTSVGGEVKISSISRNIRELTSSTKIIVLFFFR